MSGRITKGRGRARWLWACGLVLGLVACGGGEPDGQVDDGNLYADGLTAAPPASNDDAARFLTQATFGPTDASVERVRSIGYVAWLNDQLKKTPAPDQTHAAYWDARTAALKLANPNASAGTNEVTYSFWKGALSADDQLRQRVAFALSEIFVVSYAADCVGGNPRGLAHYYDTLAANAFGDYRTLLKEVATHPIMGCYLSHLKNQRENTKTGRVPDENFAREVMQLFSIGLYVLRPDGSTVQDANKHDLETYDAADISGLAKVFTGFSFDCPEWPADSCFFNGTKDGNRYDNMWSRPMVGYPQYHSFDTPKTFLDVNLPAQGKPDPEASLDAALDALAVRHPNVGPFIGKQLIQRLVTSNPSTEYVARVTAAFERSGRNMGTMIKAILLDPDARSSSSKDFGKVREPVLRLSAFLRATGATSDSGAFLIGDTSDAGGALAQSPLKAPSVFNFFRPGYVPPGGPAAAAGLVAPEMQIVHETSSAGYVNFMLRVIQNGLGSRGLDGKATRNDVQPEYLTNSASTWRKLAEQSSAAALLDHINSKLMYGTMPATLKAEVAAAVESIAFAKATATDAQKAAAINNRLWSALLLTVASPEFQVQK